MKCWIATLWTPTSSDKTNQNVFLHFQNPAWWERSVLLNLFLHILCFQTASWKKKTLKKSKRSVWEDTKLLHLVCYRINKKAGNKIWYLIVIWPIALLSLCWLEDDEKACDSSSFEKAIMSWWGSLITTYLYLKRLSILSPMPEK